MISSNTVEVIITSSSIIKGIINRDINNIIISSSSIVISMGSITNTISNKTILFEKCLSK